MIRVVQSLLWLYFFLLFLRSVTSWLVLARPNSVFSSTDRILRVMTEPLLRPIRRVVPPIRGGNFDIDPSPLVAMALVSILSAVL